MEEEPPCPGGRRVVDAHREPDLTCSTDVDVLHTRTRMLEEFRSPLADDALSGRVAIVTGGGTGIGRATARSWFGPARASRSVDGGRSRSRPCGPSSRPPHALAMPCDVREPEEVETFLDAVGERLGPVDVLVNNAGGQFAAPADPLKGLRAVHRLNVDAPWHVTNRVAERWMIPGRRGSCASWASALGAASR